MGDVYCLGDGMHDALHGFGDGDEQGMDIVESDGAHGGDLEDFVGEWTFSAVDDESAVSEFATQVVETHIAR